MNIDLKFQITSVILRDDLCRNAHFNIQYSTAIFYSLMEGGLVRSLQSVFFNLIIISLLISKENSVLIFPSGIDFAR